MPELALALEAADADFCRPSSVGLPEERSACSAETSNECRGQFRTGRREAVHPQLMFCTSKTASDLSQRMDLAVSTRQRASTGQDLQIREHSVGRGCNGTRRRGKAGHFTSKMQPPVRIFLV
jgi:hypothetical protein